MKRPIVVAAVLTAILAVGIASPAYAEGYTGELSANSSAAGGTVMYTSDNTGEPTGTSGTFTLTDSSPSAAGSQIATASRTSRTIAVGDQKSLRFAVTLPKDARAGAVYNLAVSVGSFSDQKTITVVGASTSAAPAGSNATFIWVLLGLLAAALLVVFIVIRRRSSTAV